MCSSFQCFILSAKASPLFSPPCCSVDTRRLAFSLSSFASSSAAFLPALAASSASSAPSCADARREVKVVSGKGSEDGEVNCS